MSTDTLKSPNIVTSLEFERILASCGPYGGHLVRPSDGKEPEKIAWIQCVGSRIPERPYCSRLCCTQSINRALMLKEIKPQMEVFILYQDMRSYGQWESIYKKAREVGVHFIRFNFDLPVTTESFPQGIVMSFVDPVLTRPMEIQTDLLFLSSSVIMEQNHPLAGLYKIPQNVDGFFMEAHAKLRPVEFATDGVFLCGLAHSPKPINESIAQAQAAASRAITLLSTRSLPVSGMVAYMNPAKCSQCGVCVSLCPYSAHNSTKRPAKRKFSRPCAKVAGSV